MVRMQRTKVQHLFKKRQTAYSVLIVSVSKGRNQILFQIRSVAWAQVF